MTAGTSALCVIELSKVLLESVHNFSEVSSSDCVLSSSGSSLCSVVRLASVSVGHTTLRSWSLGPARFSFTALACSYFPFQELKMATSELRSSSHSVCVVTRALSPELLLSPLAACGWDAVVLEPVCLLSRARHWCRNPACTTHVVRPCFRRLQADVCTSFTSIVFRGHVLP